MYRFQRQRGSLFVAAGRGFAISKVICSSASAALWTQEEPTTQI
jgi:hypothetical protein